MDAVTVARATYTHPPDVFFNARAENPAEYLHFL